MLGLPGLIVRDVVETFLEVQITADVVGDVPTCPSCTSGGQMSPHGSVELKFWDSPMRGKRCRLVVRRSRFICKCRRTATLATPAIAEDDFPSLTTRLARYVENQSFRRTAPGIAIETGVSETLIRRVSDRLAHHLWDNHRFATPLVLGIDDLRIRKQLFTNVTDGRTGHSIALVDGGESDKIVGEMRRREIDPTKVKIVVSDMGGSNIAVFKQLFAAHAIHVADKWHVLKGAKEALNSVINKRLDFLRRRRAWCEKVYRKRGTLPPTSKTDPYYKRKPPFSTHPLTRMQHRIDDLKNAKSKLLGMRRPFYATKQLTLDDYQMIVKPMCKKHRAVGHAFVATMRLHAVYDVEKRIDRRGADANIDLFFRLASAPDIVNQFKIIVDRVRTHRDIILNYYDAIALLGRDQPAPTTGPTEQRNSTIKNAWSAARGIRNHKVFTMRALYAPWHIDTDIAICWSDKRVIVDAVGKERSIYCNDVGGPFGDQGHTRRQQVMAPLHRHRCPLH
ncbi:Transposase [Sphingomonas sp. OK281]|nr:Transposase [Sphingomonas sp. OK281]